MFTAMAVSEDVLQMGLGLSPVAAAAHAVSVSELVDGALYSGADRIRTAPRSAGPRCVCHGRPGSGAAGADGLDHPSRTVVAGP
jgi:hypothetical protein